MGDLSCDHQTTTLYLRKSAASVKQQLLHQKRRFHLIRRKMQNTNKRRQQPINQATSKDIEKRRNKNKSHRFPRFAWPPWGLRGGQIGAPRNSPELPGRNRSLPGTPRNSPELPGTPRNSPEVPLRSPEVPDLPEDEHVEHFQTQKKK